MIFAVIRMLFRRSLTPLAVICHVFICIFQANFIARYLFTRDKIWNLPWTCCILYCYAGPGRVVRTVGMVGKHNDHRGHHICPYTFGFFGEVVALLRESYTIVVRYCYVSCSYLIELMFLELNPFGCSGNKVFNSCRILNCEFRILSVQNNPIQNFGLSTYWIRSGFWYSKIVDSTEILQLKLHSITL